MFKVAIRGALVSLVTNKWAKFYLFYLLPTIVCMTVALLTTVHVCCASCQPISWICNRVSQGTR